MLDSMKRFANQNKSSSQIIETSKKFTSEHQVIMNANRARFTSEDTHFAINPQMATRSNRSRRSVSVNDVFKLQRSVLPTPARFNDTNGVVRKSRTGSIVCIELEKDEKPLENSWTDPKVKPVPKYYPMERTTAKIPIDDFNIDEFRKTMASLFYTLSTQVHYCDDPASMSLLTPEFVEIHVALWLSRSGEDVFVEVQRRRGDSITFHTYAQSILDAALGKADSSHYTTARVDKLNLDFLLEAENLLQSIEGNKDGQPVRKRRSSSLEVIHSLLISDRVDSLLCGMESLCVLTDAQKAGVTTAAKFARVILCGEAQSAHDKRRAYDIRRIWMAALGKTLMAFETDREPGLEELCAEEFEECLPVECREDMKEASNYLYNKALTVFLNVLELSSAIEKRDTIHHPNLASMSVTDATDIVDNTELLSILVQDLDRADHMPHNAFLCAKCLTVLCTACGTVVMAGSLKTSAMAAAKRSYQYGRLHHSNLEQASHELVQVLYSK